MVDTRPLHEREPGALTVWDALATHAGVKRFEPFLGYIVGCSHNNFSVADSFCGQGYKFLFILSSVSLLFPDAASGPAIRTSSATINGKPSLARIFPLRGVKYAVGAKSHTRSQDPVSGTSFLRLVWHGGPTELPTDMAT
jgi:hypothetical protein